ncbi:Transcription factor bHLH157 [Linum perenne]
MYRPSLFPLPSTLFHLPSSLFHFTANGAKVTATSATAATEEGAEWISAVGEELGAVGGYRRLERSLKKRNRKKKDKVTNQHSTSAASGVSPGNGPEPSGEGSPGGSGSKLNAEGSLGNGTKSPEGEEVPPSSQFGTEANVEVPILDALSVMVTPKEVEEALRSMPMDKAPGPDGYPVSFYKRCWKIVGPDVTEAVLYFFHTDFKRNQTGGRLEMQKQSPGWSSPFSNFLKVFTSPLVCTQTGTRTSSESKGSAKHDAHWDFECFVEQKACPIHVEDLAHPGHLLIEVLCNERVVFLEIANVIRGLELNILKGVMQNREDNTWAHFIVEVNLDKVHLLYSLLYQPFRLTSLHCTVTGLERISEARHILAFDAASASNEKSHL